MLMIIIVVVILCYCFVCVRCCVTCRMCCFLGGVLAEVHGARRRRGHTLPFRGTKGAPKERGWNTGPYEGSKCKESRAKDDQTSCCLRPPILGTPLVPFSSTNNSSNSIIYYIDNHNNNNNNTNNNNNNNNKNNTNIIKPLSDII